MKVNSEAIKRLREAGGETQAELADRAGIAKTTLTYAERGEQEPRMRTVKKLAAALNVKLSDLQADNQSEVA